MHKVWRYLCDPTQSLHDLRSGDGMDAATLERESAYLYNVLFWRTGVYGRNSVYVDHGGVAWGRHTVPIPPDGSSPRRCEDWHGCWGEV